MKIGFVSLGCSKNLVDSETIMGMLKLANHDFVKQMSDAEMIIINTCGFIQEAKEEAINTIFEMVKFKQKKCKKIIVVGCLAQRYKDELIEMIPEIDEIITIKDYPNINTILSKHLDAPCLVPYAKSERLLTHTSWSAYLKIAEGCSNRCTYCAIPLIRGDNVSYPIDDLYEQATNLANKGVKELVIIAQDTTKYGVDIYGKRSLLQLLKKLHTIDGFEWIRVLYMYPDEIDEDLIIGIKALNKVVPYFDIPIQHINNTLLTSMHRRGSKEDIYKLVKLIRKHIPNAVLRSTFIIGFPNESENDIDELIQSMHDLNWNRLGAFTYSPEEDTSAFLMEQTVGESTKIERLNRIMSEQAIISKAWNKSREGSKVKVLVEDQEGIMGWYRGRDYSCAPDGIDGIVRFKSDKAIAFGSFVNVLIEEGDTYDCIGKEV